MFFVNVLSIYGASSCQRSLTFVLLVLVAPFITCQDNSYYYYIGNTFIIFPLLVKHVEIKYSNFCPLSWVKVAYLCVASILLWTWNLELKYFHTGGDSPPSLTWYFNPCRKAALETKIMWFVLACGSLVSETLSECLLGFEMKRYNWHM